MGEFSKDVAHIAQKDHKIQVLVLTVMALLHNRMSLEEING